MVECEVNRIKNIFAFLCVLFGEESSAVINKMMSLHPSYILEKYNRYIVSDIPEYDWGLHPNIRTHVFEPYVDKWDDYFKIIVKKLGVCQPRCR